MPSHSPLVSVILPVRDAQDYLDDAMTSLTRQFADPRNLEVVLVDDGSVDGTGDIAASYGDRLPHLTILTNTAAVGASTARNQALTEATGRYITYLDGDDWYAPGHLQDVTEAIAAHRVPILRHDHVTVEGATRKIRRGMEPRRDVVLDPRESILPASRSTMVDYPFVWAGIYDRTIGNDGLLTFSDGLRTATDRPWTWQLHLGGPAYVVTNHTGVCYRRGVTTSLTQIYDERRLDFLIAFAEIRDMVAADREAGRFLPKLVRTVLAMTGFHLAHAPHMSAELYSELVRRAADLIRTLPDHQVRAQLEESDPARWVLLRDVLASHLAPSPQLLAEHAPTEHST